MVLNFVGMVLIFFDKVLNFFDIVLNFFDIVPIFFDNTVGVAIGPLLTSAFRTDDEYIIMEIMLIIFAFLGFLTSLYLWKVDKKIYRSILQNPWIKVIKEPTDSYGLRRNSKTPSFKAKSKSPLISENKYQKK